MGIVCPYCDIEVSMHNIEAEDGCCPECRAIIPATSMLADSDQNKFEEKSDDNLADDDADI